MRYISEVTSTTRLNRFFRQKSSSETGFLKTSFQKDTEIDTGCCELLRRGGD